MAGDRFSPSFPGNLSNCSQIPWSQGYKCYLPGIQVMACPEFYALCWLILPGDAFRDLSSVILAVILVVKDGGKMTEKWKGG